MATTTAPDTALISPFLTPEDGLKRWQHVKGMSKHRPPDPIAKPEKMHQEFGP